MAIVGSGDDIASAIGVWDWAKYLAAPGISVGAIFAAFHLGGRVQKVETSVITNGACLTALEVKQDAVIKAIEVKHEANITALQLKTETLSRDHSALAVAVAALPTRSEMTTNFAELAREVRAARNS